MSSDLVVIGGGASGFMGAITAASNGFGSVVILESTLKVLEKVDEEAHKTGQLQPEQLQMASLCGGFLYLYHLAQSHQIIHSSDNTTVH